MIRSVFHTFHVRSSRDSSSLPSLNLHEDRAIKEKTFITAGRKREDQVFAVVCRVAET